MRAALAADDTNHFFFFLRMFFFRSLCMCTVQCMFVLFISGIGHVCRLFVLKSLNFSLTHSLHSFVRSFFSLLNMRLFALFTSVLIRAKNVSSKRGKKNKTNFGNINKFVCVVKRTLYLAATHAHIIIKAHILIAFGFIHKIK